MNIFDEFLYFLKNKCVQVGILNIKKIIILNNLQIN